LSPHIIRTAFKNVSYDRELFGTAPGGGSVGIAGGGLGSAGGLTGKTGGASNVGPFGAARSELSGGGG